MRKKNKRVLIILGDPKLSLAYSDDYDVFILFSYDKEVDSLLKKNRKEVYYCETCVSDQEVKTLNYNEIAKLAKNNDAEILMYMPFSKIDKVTLMFSAFIELVDFYNFERGSLHCLSKHLWTAHENLGEVLEKAIKYSDKRMLNFVKLGLKYYHELLEECTKLDLSISVNYEEALRLLKFIREVRTKLSSLVETSLIGVVDAAFIQDFGSLKKNLYAAEEHLLEYIAYLVRKKKFCPACEEEIQK